jgi:hypothetical protein
MITIIGAKASFGLTERSQIDKSTPCYGTQPSFIHPVSFKLIRTAKTVSFSRHHTHINYRSTHSKSGNPRFISTANLFTCRLPRFTSLFRDEWCRLGLPSPTLKCSILDLSVITPNRKVACLFQKTGSISELDDHTFPSMSGVVIAPSSCVPGSDRPRRSTWPRRQRNMSRGARRDCSLVAVMQ